MIDSSSLLQSLGTLEDELRASGKQETADFFKNVRGDLSNASGATEVVSILKRLYQSAAITQYANFSLKEDEYFDQCYEKAKVLLSRISNESL